MRLLMVFFDLSWFVFFTLIKVGGLTGALLYFATVADQKTRDGLMELRPITNNITRPSNN